MTSCQLRLGNVYFVPLIQILLFKIYKEYNKGYIKRPECVLTSEQTAIFLRSTPFICCLTENLSDSQVSSMSIVFNRFLRDFVYYRNVLTTIDCRRPLFRSHDKFSSCSASFGFKKKFCSLLSFIAFLLTLRALRHSILKVPLLLESY